MRGACHDRLAISHDSMGIKVRVDNNSRVGGYSKLQTGRQSR